MSDGEIAAISGMALSAQAILEEIATRLSRGGGLVGSPRDRVRIELATASQAIEMMRYWVDGVRESPHKREERP